MCGIFGILDHNDLNNDSFISSLELLKHRGPDNQTIFSENKICFGFVRLSVMELSSLGNQPMKSERTGNVLNVL